MTADNYADAIVAVVDELVARPEVDSDQIVLLGLSFGSHWAVQTVARERHIKACANNVGVDVRSSTCSSRSYRATSNCWPT